MHTIIYFPTGRRFVIMFTPITQKMVSGWNNPLIFWEFNGDIRIRNVEKILAVSYIFLFLFLFATGTGVSNFLIWYLFITCDKNFKNAFIHAENAEILFEFLPELTDEM